jgi:hypothetical protein
VGKSHEISRLLHNIKKERERGREGGREGERAKVCEILRIEGEKAYSDKFERDDGL